MALIRKTNQWAPNFGPWVQKRLIQLTYEMISLRIMSDTDGFMNYGYSPLDDAELDHSLNAEEVSTGYRANLYRRVVEAADVRGKDVLEVGSGRGAGAAFVRRISDPRSVVGVDLAGRAVAYCRRHYHLPGLSFRQGDAENLPFAAGSFDVVLNVESSHGYPNVARFFAEVARVLRPDGAFLFADFRPPEDLARLREQMEHAGLTIVEEESITANVVRALELDSDRREQFVAAKVPRPLRPNAMEFIGVRGSKVFVKFSTGELEYARLVARKV